MFNKCRKPFVNQLTNNNSITQKYLKKKKERWNLPNEDVERKIN